MYSNSGCSCSFEPEIIKIGQSSHKMYSNNILSFQESTPILNAHTKKVWKLIVSTSYLDNPCGVMVNVLDCDIVVSELKSIKTRTRLFVSLLAIVLGKRPESICSWFLIYEHNSVTDLVI